MAVGPLGRLIQRHERELGDRLPRPEHDRHAREVGDLERERPAEAGVDEARGGVHDQSQPAEARLALDAGHDVVGQLDPLDGGAEHELARVDHERRAVLDLHVLGDARGRLGQVDRRQPVIVEHAERGAELQIHARGLNHGGIPGLDLDPLLLDEAADCAVGQNRTDHAAILAATMD